MGNLLVVLAYSAFAVSSLPADPSDVLHQIANSAKFLRQIRKCDLQDSSRSKAHSTNDNESSPRELSSVSISTLTLSIPYRSCNRSRTLPKVSVTTSNDRSSVVRAAGSMCAVLKRRCNIASARD